MLNNQNKYKIGLEIHLQLLTKSKLFTNGAFNYTYFPEGSANENTCIDRVSLAVPGSYPIINKYAIIKAWIIARIFKCTIADKIDFDRKHYWYPDLPNGYQITQDRNPIGINGSYRLLNGKEIRILNVHIEADAGNLKTYKNNLQIKVVVNYNRVMIPLVEIVTDTGFSGAEEIKEFIILVLRDAKINNASRGILADGNARVDVNISKIIDEQNNVCSCRFEIKNINTFKGIKDAISFAKQELKNATELDKDKTFHYDPNVGIIFSRFKEGKSDYAYFYEHHLIPVETSYFIEKDIEVQLTIDEINKYYEKLNKKANKKTIMLFVCNKELHIILDKVVNSNYNIDFKVNILNFILENKDLFYEFEDIVDKIHSILLEAIEIIYQKKSTKVNINNAIREIINNNYNISLNQFLLDNDMIIIEGNIDENDIIALILENFKTLDEFKQSNQRSFNFMVGIIIKKLKFSPVIIKEMLIKIKNN